MSDGINASPPAAGAKAQGDAAPSFLALALGSVGVVYGDIGTSPLYAFREAAIAASDNHPVSRGIVLGVLSLILWALIVTVTLKYVLILLRADNNGEGGTLSLTALATRALGRRTTFVFIVGVIGASMFLGDSVITPAISVLSAVEGLNVATTLFEPYIIPLTLAVLVGLFVVQRWGTGAVGKVFGPVMLLWFGTLAVLGVQHIALAPQVLQAANPWWAAAFIADHPSQTLVVLGSVFLAVTGGEALYADMGHFGARAIRQAWLFIALPALLLNYFGQGALVLKNPAAIDNPFFRLLPAWGVVPMVVLAGIATVIASQAVISGAFSLSAQAMRMGYLPRLRIVQTSGAAMGQIYLPSVNWLLMAGVVLLVVGFRSSSALSTAYGIAVSITMVTTTLLAAVVALQLWRWNRPLVLAGALLFLSIDVLFVVANSLKIAEGGWLPLAVAAIVLSVFTTWHRGRRLTRQSLEADRLELAPFVASLLQAPPHRVRGTAVFLTPESGLVPHALLHNLKHNQVLHEHVVVLAVQAMDTPRVEAAQRIEAHELGAGFWSVTARHGFMEVPDVPEFLKVLSYQKAIPAGTMTTSYFTTRETVATGCLQGMTSARQALFVWLHRNAGRASDYFRLPANRVVEFGRRA
jgi:KUP system potassium uptake protein